MIRLHSNNLQQVLLHNLLQLLHQQIIQQLQLHQLSLSNLHSNLFNLIILTHNNNQQIKIINSNSNNLILMLRKLQMCWKKWKTHGGWFLLIFLMKFKKIFQILNREINRQIMLLKHGEHLNKIQLKIHSNNS